MMMVKNRRRCPGRPGGTREAKREIKERLKDREWRVEGNQVEGSKAMA